MEYVKGDWMWYTAYVIKIVTLILGFLTSDETEIFQFIFAFVLMSLMALGTLIKLRTKSLQ